MAKTEKILQEVKDLMEEASARGWTIRDLCYKAPLGTSSYYKIKNSKNGKDVRLSTLLLYREVLQEIADTGEYTGDNRP